MKSAAAVAPAAALIIKFCDGDVAVKAAVKATVKATPVQDVLGL